MLCTILYLLKCKYAKSQQKIHKVHQVLQHISLEYIRLSQLFTKLEIKSRLPLSPEIPLNITLSQLGLL